MFRLFVDSSNGLDVEPEYNYQENDKKIENRHRTRDGSEYVYKWGDYKMWKFDIRWVNSAFRSTVNSWWNTNTELLFMEEGGTEVFSVRLTNKSLPISKFERPYTDTFRGIIELGSY